MPAYRVGVMDVSTRDGQRGISEWEVVGSASDRDGGVAGIKGVPGRQPAGLTVGPEDGDAHGSSCK